MFTGQMEFAIKIIIAAIINCSIIFIAHFIHFVFLFQKWSGMMPGGARVFEQYPDAKTFFQFKYCSIIVKII